ncbi:MAG TPA: wax ester/triacylglycerol synthase domain-containing protein, partial [Phytomonospora sp.]
MSNVDAAWLGMDAPENLMMVTAVLALDEVVDRERVAAVLQERMLDRFPRFRMRAVPSGSPFEQPVWQDDPGFTLDDHLVDGGEVADEHALRERVSDLLGTPLDMTRSPWRIELVTIASPYGGPPSSALVARLHHCLADGIALARVLLSLTDEAGPDDGEAGTTSGAAAARDARRPGLVARLRSGSAEVA